MNGLVSFKLIVPDTVLLCIERCAVCFTEDPLLPITYGSLVAPPCWHFGSPLVFYRSGRQVSIMVDEIIDFGNRDLGCDGGAPAQSALGRQVIRQSAHGKCQPFDAALNDGNG